MGSVILVNDERSATLSDKPNARKRKGSQHTDSFLLMMRGLASSERQMTGPAPEEAMIGWNWSTDTVNNSSYLDFL